MAHLALAADSRLDQALAPSTGRTYLATCRTFLAFMIFHSLHISQVNVAVILAFLEFLHVNGKSHGIIANSLAAVKFHLMKLGLEPTISNIQKSLILLKPYRRLLRWQLD